MCRLAAGLDWPYRLNECDLVVALVLVFILILALVVILLLIVSSVSVHSRAFCLRVVIISR